MFISKNYQIREINIAKYSNSPESGNLEEYLSNNWKKITKIAATGLIALVGLAQSFYTIPADSKGVIKRLGSYNQTTEPGIHFKIPFGIDHVNKVPVTQVLKEEFGFRTIKSGIESSFIGAGDENASAELKEEIKKEYLMLTGDLNMADIEWVVQYTIKDPVSYLFNVEEPRAIMRDCSLAVMKQIIGDGSVDEAITIGREDNENKSKEMLQKIIDSYGSGIQIVGVKMQSTNPPTRVKPYFNEVSSAMQERETAINQARGNYNKVIPEARGTAGKTIKEAEAFAVERVNQAQGETEKYTKILKEYSKYPEITRTRLYLESMGEILPKTGEKTFIEQKGADGGLLLKLNVDGEKK